MIAKGQNHHVDGKNDADGGKEPSDRQIHLADSFLIPLGQRLVQCTAGHTADATL